MRKADNLPPSCAVVTKSGSLKFLEPSGPVQACSGTALPGEGQVECFCIYGDEPSGFRIMRVISWLCEELSASEEGLRSTQLETWTPLSMRAVDFQSCKERYSHSELDNLGIVVRFRFVSSTKVSAPVHWVPGFVPWRYSGRGLKMTALFYSAEVKNEWSYASTSPCAMQRDSSSLSLLCLITLVVPWPKFVTVSIRCGILCDLRNAWYMRRFSA